MPSYRSTLCSIPAQPISMGDLNEPVASSGPFVMNSTTEILEAMRDYQMGKMGVLIESFDSPTS